MGTKRLNEGQFAWSNRCFLLVCCFLLINQCIVGAFALDDDAAANSANDKVCMVVNDYCIYSKDENNCESTVIHPYTCLNQISDGGALATTRRSPQTQKCEFLLDWNVQKDGIVRFSMTKYNQQWNHWIALIFSKNNLDDNLYESDIVIVLFPSNNQAKIIDGVIKGTDVLLNEYMDDLSEKRIFDEMLNITRTYADIKFSRRLEYNIAGAGSKQQQTQQETPSPGVRLNQCSSAADGFNIFYIQGKMDERNSILFNTTSAPVSIGPFCFRDCQLNLAPISVSTVTTTTTTTTIRPLSMLFKDVAFVQGKSALKTNSPQDSTSQNRNSQPFAVKVDAKAADDTSSTAATIATTTAATAATTTSIPATTQQTSTVAAETTTSNPTTASSTNNPTTTGATSSATTVASTTAITSTNTAAATSTSTVTATTATSVTASSTTQTQTTVSATTSSVTTTSVTTASETTATGTTQVTTAGSTNTATQPSTTMAPTTTTLDPSAFCSVYSVSSNNGTSISLVYAKSTDVITLSATFTNLISLFTNGAVGSSLRLGVFIRNSAVNDTYLYWIEFNQTTILKTNQNSNESAQIKTNSSLNTAINTTNVEITLPRSVQLHNGSISMQDCFEFRFFYSNSTTTTLEQFIAQYLSYSNLLTTTNSNCFLCSIAPKSNTPIYMQFVYSKVDWDPNYTSLTSSSSVNLSKTIQAEIAKQFQTYKDGNVFILNNFTILYINQTSGSSGKTRVKANKAATPSGVNVIGQLSVQSPQSSQQTQSSVRDLVDSMDSITVTAASLDPLTIDNGQTQPFFDYDYQKRFALALTFSLIATLIVFGAALFAFEYWKKKHYGEDYSSSSGGTNRGYGLAVPNRQARYEGQTIQMDNIGGGDGIGNEFEFNFANAGFSRFDDDDDNMHNNTHHTGGGGGVGYQTKSTIGGNNNLNNARDINKSLHSNNTTTTTAYFPDYTGSREVGIDVGTPPPPSAQSKPSLIPPELPPLPAVPKYPLVAKSSSGDTLNNNLVSENIKLSQLSQQMPSKMAPNAPNAPKLTNKDSSEEEEEEEDDDLNFSYFDAYKKGGVIQEEKKDKKTAPSAADQIAMQKSSEKEFKPMNIEAVKKPAPMKFQESSEEEEEAEEEEAEEEEEEEEEEDLRTETETTQNGGSESHNIFSKENIEESLPELFGSYKSSTNMISSTENSSSINVKPPNLIVGNMSGTKQAGELDVLRARGAHSGTASTDKFMMMASAAASRHYTIPETETENDDYNEDAEDEDDDEEEEEESSSYSSFKNANKLDKLKPKQAVRVTNVNHRIMDTSTTTDEGGIGSGLASGVETGGADSSNQRVAESMTASSNSSTASSSSSSSSSDEYDYKAVDKNKIAKVKSAPKAATPVSVTRINEEEPESVVVHDEDDYAQEDDSGGNAKNGGGNYFLNGASLKSESDYFFLNGIAEYATPRVCKLIKDPSYDGLGIHLCDSKNHMIKAIEPSSPAELSGLKPGDKILYVNEDNVEEASYANVIEKLKNALSSGGDEINLIVMNAIEYNIFKGKAKKAQKMENNGEDMATDESSSPKQPMKFKASAASQLSQLGMPTSTTGATDGGDDSSKFDIIFGSTNKPLSTTTNPFDSPPTAGDEFNPFDDITNEIYTPFLHYASIPPPPESFKEDTVVDLNDLTTSYNVLNNNSNSTSIQPINHNQFDLFDNSGATSATNTSKHHRPKSSKSGGVVVKNSGNYFGGDGSGSESTSETVSSSIETNNNNGSSNNRLKNFDFNN